ncbi:phosphate/phosphite/phosphonate ABC transporter substrate-binding protein [Paenibacillus albus]|uniref:Phosphate/phosphite/phosphonate ABC transporter substrate-binding protein n=1 Tax=Paenibacillus albus TaxID=2495582 RepID=A0A3S9A0B3_9BACL|nr:phosphate/phosphite/phosphonate ABC transporter substrate-binding protein [Paenibacillus albus]AZN39161.1 phosphate/phosphite/phosphonate ABC transporter substrate-binding protein [Paenibacillus albus]
MRRGVVIFVCIAVILCAAYFIRQGGESDHLTIGLVPSGDPETMKKNFEPVRAYLEQETGYKVVTTIPKDYAGLIEAMKNKEVDIGWFGAFSYIAAKSEMELEPLVIQYRKGSGITYRSLIITKQDSQIHSIEDLQGKTFAFVDPGSTSGFVIPYSLFNSRHIDMTRYFAKTVYSGSHDAVLLDVMSKKVDAGAMEDLTLKKNIEAGKYKEQDIRVIWQSNEIPGSPFVARADLSDRAKKKFKTAMLTIHEKSPDSIRVLDAKIEKYVEVQDSQYNEISNISNVLGKQFILDNFLKKK